MTDIEAKLIEAIRAEPWGQGVELQDLRRPDSRRWSLCFNWPDYLPILISERWTLLSDEAKLVAFAMASELAYREDLPID